MAKATIKRKTKIKSSTDLDGVFFLKIVLYMIIGSQWIMFTDNAQSSQIPIPVGLAVGSLFAMHDHFMIDRKIEYAVLVIACLVGFWTQTGIFIRIL